MLWMWVVHNCMQEKCNSNEIDNKGFIYPEIDEKLVLNVVCA